MSAVDTKFYDKKKKTWLYASWGILLLVAILTGGLYYYNMQLDSELWDLESDITQVETSIDSINQESDVQIYSIYSRHQDFLKRLEVNSKISSMVNHLKRTFTIHELQYDRFSYSNETVTIDLSLETNDSWYAYEKVTSFLRNYRENEQALFDVEQVSEISWYDRMSFTAVFTLK